MQKETNLTKREDRGSRQERGNKRFLMMRFLRYRETAAIQSDSKINKEKEKKRQRNKCIIGV